MIRTSLYEKLFIDGFKKPSYVVVTIFLERPPDDSTFTSAVLRTLTLHPRLRSTIRTRFALPTAFLPAAPTSWKGLTVHDEPVHIQTLEERLLSTPLDLTHQLPLEVHLLREPTAIVAKVHHAVVDGASGFTVLHDFAKALDGAPIAPREDCRRSPMGIRDWLRRAQLRPRLPDSSVVASFRPTTSLESEPVRYADLFVPGAYRRLARSARARGATFSELVASALMTAMARYNADRATNPPTTVGLMFARARGRRTASDAAFRSDTCIISAPRAQLDRPHDPATLAELRRRANENRHNDLALLAADVFEARLYPSEFQLPPRRA